MGDRRGSARIRVKLFVRYHSDSVLLDGWVENLSNNGLFLRSEVLDVEGQQVRLRLTLPGDPKPVYLDGEVARVVGDRPETGMGIRILDISPLERRRLANFMIERHHETRYATQA
jgi:uncharacterized protein (TIGR02266 family)